MNFSDFVESMGGSKHRAGCATTVRVQLKNGIFHEGMGYSCLEGSSKGSALQKVRLVSCILKREKRTKHF